MLTCADVAYETEEQGKEGTHDLDLKLLLRVLKWESREGAWRAAAILIADRAVLR